MVKFGVTYPLRTGLGTPSEADFSENITYFYPDCPDAAGNGVFEEAYLYRGTCLLSEGPIGGPSFIKGLFRPELSYSTGIGIKCVVKVRFPSGEEEGLDAG